MNVNREDRPWALAHSNTTTGHRVDAYRMPYIPWNLTPKDLFCGVSGAHLTGAVCWDKRGAQLHRSAG